MKATLTLFCCLALCPAAASLAEVKVKVGEDGIPFIYNENSEQRSWRLADRLRELSDRDLAAMIVRHADRQGLGRRLVQAVVQVESGYNPRALSRKGAMGLMQLMPETARELLIADPYDPEENLRGGTDYLRRMLDRFGDLQMALAAYNAGPTAVERHQGVPPYAETRTYVQRVLALLDGDGELEIRTQRRAAAPSPKIYVTRDAQNRLVMTTTPPGKGR